MRKTAAISILVVLGVVSATYGAPLVVEGTINALSSNSCTVDYWNFTVDAPGTVTVDVLSMEIRPNGHTYDVNGDGEIAFIDPMIRLFSDDGHLDSGDLVATNDDSSQTYGDGSIHYYDSYLSQYLGLGDYVLAISAYNLSVSEALSGVNYCASPYTTCFQRNDHGDYQITFDGIAPEGADVPEPATLLLFGVGAAGLAVLRRRQTG